MAGPRDALRSVRAARSVPDRLERVEDAVRELAAAKDDQQTLLDHLSGALDRRIAALETRLTGLEDDLLRRRALTAVIPFDPARLAVVTVGGEPESETATQVAADGASETEYVAFLRPGDRLAAGWPAVAIEALDDNPEVVAVYGERIDVIAPSAPGAPATLINRFEPVFDRDAIEQSPCIDLSSVVVRRGHLDGELPPPDGWALLRRLATLGALLPVPVTASVGPISDPTT